MAISLAAVHDLSVSFCLFFGLVFLDYKDRDWNPEVANMLSYEKH